MLICCASDSALSNPQGRNKALYDSALGTELKYGNNVALRHARSGKFVDVQVPPPPLGSP